MRSRPTHHIATLIKRANELSVECSRRCSSSYETNRTEASAWFNAGTYLEGAIREIRRAARLHGK